MPSGIEKLSAEELEGTLNSMAAARPCTKRVKATNRKMRHKLRAHIAYLDAQLDQTEAEYECRATDLNRVIAKNELLRDALDETLKALVQAQDHIRNELQPEFEELAEHGKLTWVWPSEEYCEYTAARRLATWWHGVGTDETIERAHQALDKTEDEKP